MHDPPAAPGLHPPPRYAAFYCEENVWQLCRHPALAGRPLRAVFVSNAARACALWAQRGAPAPGEPVVWDYHLVAVEAADAARVWDLDSALGLPVPLDDYLAATFRPVAEPHGPRFRVVDAAEYVGRLASDRGHMRAPDGSWLMPPPPWPPPRPAGAPSNQMRFVDMAAPFVGEVTDLAGLPRALRGDG